MSTDLKKYFKNIALRCIIPSVWVAQEHIHNCANYETLSLSWEERQTKKKKQNDCHFKNVGHTD